MTPETLAEYRKNRADHPGIGALSAYRWVKARKPHSFEWDDSGTGQTGTATIDGYDVVATIADDYDVDPSETYGTLTMDWERGAFPNPYFRERHHGGHGERTGDYARYHESHCSSDHDEDGAARWYIDSADDTLDELRAYLRKSGVARHEAYSRALADFRERADTCRTQYQDWRGKYSFAYVTATASLAGVEIAQSSFGGYAWERDYGRPLDPQLDEIVSDAVYEVLAEAPSKVLDAVGSELLAATERLDRASALRHAYRAIAP